MILTLFLSYGGSLGRWQQQNILSREIELYFELIRVGTFQQVYIFSYDANDRVFAKQLNKDDPRYGAVALITPHHSSGISMIDHFLWSLLGPFLHRAAIRQSLALKTNQISGSWAAMIARLATGRPLILRAGYILSRRFSKNGQYLKAAVAKVVEFFACALARQIIVTSESSANIVTSKRNRHKIQILPSYVDTALFQAKQNYDFSRPLVTVSRMYPQKNLANLIRACDRLSLPLTIYGDGEQRRELEELAERTGAQVSFAGTVQNAEMAQRLAEHTIFLLPSLHEGLPKALLEAMACGLICIGSRIPGIADLIEDEKNGYLINGFRPEDIALAIQRALGACDSGIGKAARMTIENGFGLTQCAGRESMIYANLT